MLAVRSDIQVREYIVLSRETNALKSEANWKGQGNKATNLFDHSSMQIIMLNNFIWPKNPGGGDGLRVIGLGILLNSMTSCWSRANDDNDSLL